MFDRLRSSLGPAPQHQPPTPAAPGQPGQRFDPDKVHPVWCPGVGYELREGEGPGTSVTLDGLRAYIAATRVADGDKEADRLQAEMDGLLAIKERVEQRQKEARGGAADPG